MPHSEDSDGAEAAATAGRVPRGRMRRAGFSVARQTGSHQTWQHPAMPGYSLTVAGADGADAQPYQERDVRDALTRARAAREDERRP